MYLNDFAVFPCQCSLLLICFYPFRAFTVLLACLPVISCFLNVYYFWPLTLSHFLPSLSDLLLNSFCCNWKWCSHQHLVQPLSWISADQSCFSVWYSFMWCVPEYNVYCSLLLHPDHALLDDSGTSSNEKPFTTSCLTTSAYHLSFYKPLFILHQPRYLVMLSHLNPWMSNKDRSILAWSITEAMESIDLHRQRWGRQQWNMNSSSPSLPCASWIGLRPHTAVSILQSQAVQQQLFKMFYWTCHTKCSWHEVV
jgi:hypothetical protein